MSQTSGFTRARQLTRVLRQLPAVLTADTALAPKPHIRPDSYSGGTN